MKLDSKSVWGMRRGDLVFFRDDCEENHIGRVLGRASGTDDDGDCGYEDGLCIVVPDDLFTRCEIQVVMPCNISETCRCSPATVAKWFFDKDWPKTNDKAKELLESIENGHMRVKTKIRGFL